MGSPALWYNNFLNSSVVPPHNNRLVVSKSVGYAFSLARLDFKELPNESAFDVSVFFYDTSQRQFFGRQWVSEVRRGQGSDQLPFRDTVFFSAAQKADKVVLVVELVKRDRESWVYGWTVVPLVSKSHALTDFSTSASRNFPWKRFQFFKGSCKCLLYTDAPLEESPQLQKRDVILNCVLQTHQKLDDCLAYLPDFYLVGPKDHVPGLKSHEGELLLIQPEPLSCFLGILDNVQIFYTAHNLESQVLELMHHERCFKMNKSPSDSQVRPLTVIDRRLKVGVHNSLTFVETPVRFELGTDFSEQTPRRRTRSLSRPGAQIRSVQDSFTVAHNIRLQKLFADENCAVVLMLEYQVGVSRANGIHTDTEWILVAWNAWCPYSNGTFTLADTVTVPLVGGPRPNPEDVLCVKNLLTMRAGQKVMDMVDTQVRLKFNFALVGSADNNSLYQIPAKQGVTPEPRPDLFLHQAVHSAREPAKTHPPAQPKPVPAELIRADLHAEPDVPTDILRSERSQQARPREVLIEPAEFSHVLEERLPGSPRTHSLPRHVEALIAQLNLPNLLDRHGQKARTVEFGTKRDLNMNLDYHTRLQTHEILLQIVGIMPIRNGYLSFHKKSFNYFFTVSFYRFETITTEILIAKPLANAKKGDPFIFHRMDENEKPLEESGFTLRFVVERCAVSSDEPHDFYDYLLKGHLFIDVWDAESLMHLGVTAVPLQALLRQGSDGVQTQLQGSVVERGIPLCEATVTSVLYIRMANMGYPSLNQLDVFTSRNQDVVISTRLPRLISSTLSGDAFNAKPLSAIHESALQRFFAAQRLDIKQRREELFSDENLDLIRNWEQLKQQSSVRTKSKLKKFLFSEELEAYKRLRHENKASKLLKAVFQSITTTITLVLRPTQTRFFEFTLRNTFADPINCVVDVNDPRLKLVTDLKEWTFFNKLNKSTSQPESGFVNYTADGQPFIFLKALESVQVPFKVDSYVEGDFGGTSEPFEAKAIFKHSETQEPVSILEVCCQCTRSALSQRFRWFFEENVKFTKIVKSPGPSLTQAVRCSDPNILCLLRNSPGGGQELLISGYSHESPLCLDFTVSTFADRFFSEIVATFGVTVHSLQRVDVRAVQEQTSRVPLNICPDLPVDVIVEMHSSNDFVSFAPTNTFVNLSTLSSSKALVRPDFTGTKAVIVTAVEHSIKKLLCGWIFYVNSSKPNIVKSYKVEIPLFSNSDVVKIGVDNLFSAPRKFFIHTSNPKVVSVVEPEVFVESNSSVGVDLVFHPTTATKPFTLNEIVFVENSENGHQEEAYSLLLTYT